MELCFAAAACGHLQTTGGTGKEISLVVGKIHHLKIISLAEALAAARCCTVVRCKATTSNKQHETWGRVELPNEGNRIVKKDFSGCQYDVMCFLFVCLFVTRLNMVSQDGCFRKELIACEGCWRDQINNC